MNAKLNLFPNYALSFFQERILPSLTAKQKKILVIVSDDDKKYSVWTHYDHLKDCHL